jgi:hypothetical protein
MPAVVLGVVVEADAVALGVVALGVVAEAVAVPLGVVVEAEVLGVVEAVALTLPVALGVAVVLPVVAGPVAEADVPGAEALVLPMVDAVPVWDAAPAEVVALPGAVADVLGVVDAEVLGVVDVVALGVVAADEVVELMPAVVDVLGVVLEAEVVLSAGGRLAEPAALQLPITRTLCPTCAVRS